MAARDGQDDILAKAAASFVEARRGRPQWAEVPVAHRPGDAAQGYRLQQAVHRHLEAEGQRRVGYKIGSTSKPGQAVYGLDEPIYAGIFESSQAADLRTALGRDMIEPSLECEVAVRLSSGLDARERLLTREEVRGAIGACCLACEVIDNRYGDALAVGVPSLLADDFFHAAFVLGTANASWQDLDLANLTGTIEVDGQAAEGRSVDVLEPIAALQWLAGALARSGVSLQPGELVLTGSLPAPFRIHLPVRSVTLSIGGFESLRLD